MKITALKISKVPKVQNETLDETLEKMICDSIKENPSTTQKDIAQVTGSSLSTAKRAIKKMSDDGIIERKGGKRYGYWEIRQ